MSPSREDAPARGVSNANVEPTAVDATPYEEETSAGRGVAGGDTGMEICVGSPTRRCQRGLSAKPQSNFNSNVSRLGSDLTLEVAELSSPSSLVLNLLTRGGGAAIWEGVGIALPLCTARAGSRGV